jgi:carbon-monoxide dehydrogenase small subunit
VAEVSLTLRINGKKKKLRAHPMARLLDVLREEGGLTGTKEGCGEGECGACSVFLDGKLVNSCLVPFLQASGSVIRTIEGVAPKGKLHPVQDAFLKGGGAQCGICTPGMVLASVALYERAKREKKSAKRVTDAEIREALAGNLCRCTGYTKIFESVRAALRGATK